MNIAEKKTFNFFRILGITALVCTIILWAGLWISSGIPSKKVLNSAISDSMDNTFDLNSSIKGTSATAFISFSYADTPHYTGDKTELKVAYYPSNAKDRDVVFSSSNENVATVDEQGIVTWTGQGEVDITMSLKNNPDIYYKRRLYSLGERPTQESVFTIGYKNGVIDLYSSNEVFIDGGKTSRVGPSYASSNEDVVTVDRYGLVRGVGIGTATITAKIGDVTLTKEVSVVKNPSFVSATEIILKDDISFNTETQYYYIPKLISSLGVENATFYDIRVESSNPQIAFEGGYTIDVINYGEVTLTFYSQSNPEIRTELTTYVQPVMPTTLGVSAPTVVVPHDLYQLSAAHTPKAYNSAVTWEVIKGQATITEKGVLTATFWGDIVVRCTSTIDPNIYTDVTIKCQLFDSAYYFVRKLMGHFGLSALLGFGIFFSIFLMDKHKWKAFALTPVLSFGYAGISELIQYFTPLRSCTLTDVLIDFIGALIGMAVAMVIFALITIIWRLVSKKTFGAYTSTLKGLNIHNARQKAYVADEYTREAPCTTAQKQPISA